MKQTFGFRIVSVLALTALAMVACSGETTPEPQATPVEAEPLPDPGPEEAKEVEKFVREFVAEKAGEGSVFDIPARGDEDRSGTLSAFHTVHQKDSTTYSVCVDFKDGDDVYDVDFLVLRTQYGLSLNDHYLHKINDKALE